MAGADVVIVGGGQAGAQAAIGLMEAKFPGSVLLLTDEADDPYHRPPLSKHYLEGSVVRSLCGRPAPYRSVPTFWSEQYDLKLQGIGLSAGHDAALVCGNPQSRSFSVVYLAAGRVIALDCVNAPRDFVRGRRLVVERTTVDPAWLAGSRSLKDLSELLPDVRRAAAAQ